MTKSDYKLVSVSDISEKEFKDNYIRKKRPLLMKGKISDWNACKKWTPDYIAMQAPNLCITVKKYDQKTFSTTYNLTLQEYAYYLKQCMSELSETSKEVLYCHDIPIFHLITDLLEDVGNEHLPFLPSWYKNRWWQYVQFFLGPKNSVTPLHFDCLLTNNLFFQIYGRKKFIIFDYQDAKYCGRYDWRWFKLNPETPDLEQFPLYAKANPIEVIVNPGDILYLPPGTLHMVRSLDPSISFNIDFHTASSSLKGFASIIRGMPIKNGYYNLLCTLGLLCKVPERIIFPFYKSYLNYIS